MSISTNASPSSFARFVGDLVDGARADRDGVFNTLDAINRQTRTVSERLAAQVDQFLAAARPEQTDQAATADDRDARFDPEDEWDLPSTTVQVRIDAQPGHAVRSATPNDDDDDLPATWLR